MGPMISAMDTATLHSQSKTSRLEHERLSALGYAPGDTKSLEHQGRPLATFFFLQDPDGYKIEVLQRAGRYK